MTDEPNSVSKHSPGYVISAGTQVVLRVSKTLIGSDCFKKPGSVGVISKCPDRADGRYLVEFADGTAARARFEELTLRRKEIDSALSQTLHDFRPYIIYRCQVGSKAFGLSREGSDDDIRGIFLPPARLHWSLYAIPEQIECMDGGQDEVFWEIEKFVRLCLKANPNVLEVLWTPLIFEANDIARELLDIRSAFLSKHVYKTYSGYVLSQFRRMNNAIEKTNAYKSKHAMHLIRLLHSGISALESGEIQIDVGEHREELLNISTGKLSFEEVRARALELDKRFQAAFDKTSLPEQPDFSRVDDFLISARRAALDTEVQATPAD